MRKQKERTVRYTYGFTLNSKKESDLINVLDNLEGISIAQFIKVALMYFNEDMENFLDSRDINDPQERFNAKFDLYIDQFKKYQETHK